MSEWQALAADASAAAPSFVVWKHGDRIARAGGDLDATAARSDWQAVGQVVEHWAAELGCIAVVHCPHVPARLVLVAAGGAVGDALLQVDLVARRPVGAGSWFDAESVAAAAFVDERGVRRLSPGAEGLLRALDDPTDAAARALLDGDRAGAEAMAEQLGLPRTLLLRAAQGSSVARVIGAAWPQRELSLQRYRPCAVTRALGQERRAPPEWLDAVRATHEVHDVG